MASTPGRMRSPMTSSDKDELELRVRLTLRWQPAVPLSLALSVSLPVVFSVSRCRSWLGLTADSLCVCVCARAAMQLSNIRSFTSAHQDFVQQKIDDQQRLLALLKTPSPQRRNAAAAAAAARTPPPVPAEAVSPNSKAGSTTPRGSPPKAVHTTMVQVQTSRPVERALSPTSDGTSAPAPTSPPPGANRVCPCAPLTGWQW